MSDPQTRDENGLEADITLARSYAINADLGADPDAAVSPAARDRALQARSDRYARYARDLLHDLGADRQRVQAVAEACRTEHARDIARRLPAEGGHATAAHLADLGLDALRRAEAAHGLRGRDELMAELTVERAPIRSTYKQGLRTGTVGPGGSCAASAPSGGIAVS